MAADTVIQCFSSSQTCSMMFMSGRPGENSDVVVVQPLLCTMCGVLAVIVMLEDDGISGEGVVVQCP